METINKNRTEVVAMPYIRFKCVTEKPYVGWPEHAQVLPPIGATMMNVDGVELVVIKQLFLVDGTIRLVID